ncbi:uncharacterized protein LOC135682478 [Rhopilema esculentum]|uniref:uncharacterized protein LOC135682478 n=1 Tax=Rhopilema esculentum TaxID=499914 RepID=UPI0031D2C447|eukprot:gene5102-220_t
MVLEISESAHGDQHLEPHKERKLDKLKAIWDDKHFKHFVAGGIAGAVSRTCVSPLERNKILLQLQVHDAKFKGVFGTLKTIWKEEGIIGYFKGNGINVARIAPYTAVQFMTYEECKKLMNIPEDPREQHPFKKLTAGAIAGIVSVATTYPMDLVRTRLAAQGEGTQKKYRGIFHCFSTILKEEGGLLSGSLFRGLGPTLIGVAPYVGLNFLVFETTKGWCLPLINKNLEENEAPSKDLPVPWKLLCGSVAGAVSQTLTYPIDVIRRRMQMKGTHGNVFAYNSTLHACKMIFQKEGIYGLYKGNVPNLVKVAPAIGIQFAAYEVCRSLLYGEKVRWVH